MAVKVTLLSDRGHDMNVIQACCDARRRKLASSGSVGKGDLSLSQESL